MDLQTILAGIIGGIIVLSAEQIYLHFKEKNKDNKQKVIRFAHDERIIDASIFSHLKHGSSIELMKSVLGTPNKVSKYDLPVFATSSFDTEFDEEGNSKQPANWEEGFGVPTNSYLYSFKNADVKITSKDGETIDSLTVIANDNTLEFGYLIFPWNEDERLKFNEVLVTSEMVEDCRPEYIQTRWDNVFVLSLYIGSPTYDYVTYFGYANYKEGVEVDKDHPQNFVGGTITGVCLSQNDTDAYYIYFSEIR